MDILVKNKNLFNSLLYYVHQIKKTNNYKNYELYYLYDIISKMSSIIEEDIKINKFIYDKNDKLIVNKFINFLYDLINKFIGSFDEFAIIINSKNDYYKNNLYSINDYPLL